MKNAGISPAIVHDLFGHESPEISAQIRKLGADPLPMSVADFDAMIQRELVENARLIKAAGIKAN